MALYRFAALRPLAPNSMSRVTRRREPSCAFVGSPRSVHCLACAVTQLGGVQEAERLGWDAVVRIGSLRGVYGLAVVLLEALYRLVGIVRLNDPRDGSSNTALLFHHGKLNALVENAQPFELVVSADGHLLSDPTPHFDFFGKWPYPVRYGSSPALTHTHTHTHRTGCIPARHATLLVHGAWMSSRHTVCCFCVVLCPRAAPT